MFMTHKNINKIPFKWINIWIKSSSNEQISIKTNIIIDYIILNIYLPIILTL